jgi:stage II sporulation protein GA (sporulation sigma-E factor processing peptidase)
MISFVFAGMMLALQCTIHSDVITTNNSYVYANFSIGFLVISTTVCYAILCVVRYLVDKNTGATGEWSLRISYGGKLIEVDGLADTGNALTDTFSGKPIVICSRESLESLLEVPTLDSLDTLRGFRLVPFSTIGESGVVVSFKPDSVTIVDTTSGFSKSVDVLIGISGECERAIFNPKILV